MKMKDFRALVKSTGPCNIGWIWFLKETKNKTVKKFFEDSKTIDNAQHYRCFGRHYNPHAYLIYIFRMCLDHGENSLVNLQYGDFNFSITYENYLEELFDIDDDFEIPIPQLCDILIEAFGNNYDQYV